MFLVQDFQYLSPKCTITPGIISDHSLVQFTFKQNSVWTRSRGFWKFNAQLLKDEEYVFKINYFLSNFLLKEQEHDNKSLLWDFIKCKIRGITISYVSYIVKQKRFYENNLTSKFRSLEMALGEAPSADLLQSYEDTKVELHQLHLDRAKGSILRSKAQLVENDTKSINYLQSIEKRNFNSKCIRCLKTQKGDIFVEEEILNEERQYYKSLYSHDISKNNTPHCKKALEDLFLHTDNIPKLTETEKYACDQMVSITECGKALYEMENNKSPGCDGFTVEFYKFFWDKIKMFLHNSFVWSFQHNFYHSIKEGELSL